MDISTTISQGLWGNLNVEVSAQYLTGPLQEGVPVYPSCPQLTALIPGRSTIFSSNFSKPSIYFKNRTLRVMYFLPRSINLAFHHFCFISYLYTSHCLLLRLFSSLLTTLVFSRKNDIFLHIHINKLTMPQRCNVSYLVCSLHPDFANCTSDVL